MNNKKRGFVSNDSEPVIHQYRVYIQCVTSCVSTEGQQFFSFREDWATTVHAMLTASEKRTPKKR